MIEFVIYGHNFDPFRLKCLLSSCNILSAGTLTPMDSRDFSTRQLGWLNWRDAGLTGQDVHESVKTLGAMAGMFLQSAQNLDSATVLYRVQWVGPESRANEGALLFGSTVIESGQVGDEYFMTHGHFHQLRDLGEMYTTVAGYGALILMDETRRTWMEAMAPGSIHYIPGALAHRVANIGPTQLKFLACWPAQAGHDYDSIKASGFGARLMCRNGKPLLIGSAL